jgi:hypothetical protein
VAVLKLPVVLEWSASIPRAVFSLLSQICGHCAWVSGGGPKRATPTMSWMSPATAPQWRDDRFIESVVREVLVFIKQAFPFPRFVDSAAEGLNGGKKLSGEASSFRIQTSVSMKFLPRISSALQIG